MSAKVVILFGAPGSGKGTQAKNLAKNNPGWAHISTGDLFRAEIASGSALGNSVKTLLATGQLVSDGVTDQVFQSQVKKLMAEKSLNVLLLDGYPRTRPQAESLVKFASPQNNLSTPFVVELVVDKNEIVSRLSGRLTNLRTGRIYHKTMNPPKVPGICDDDGGPLTQRDDDKEATIVKRYNTYVSERDAVVAGLKAPVEAIQGTGDMAQITNQIAATIKKHFSI